MASQLLESGRREQSLLDFTGAVCEEVTQGSSTFQALAEREKCLAQLAVLKQDHHAALEEHRLTAQDNFFQTTGKMRGLAQLIDANPDDTLSLLNQAIQDSTDQPSLYYLKDETRSWPALLLARLYARMFDHRLIKLGEAKDWCEQVLSAVSPLPSSSYQQEYLTIYQGIESWLDGAPIVPQPLPDGEPSLLRDSHVLALSILTMGYEARTRGETGLNLDDALSDRRGWLEGDFIIEEATVSRPSSKYLNYVFPAVRLALLAVGQVSRLEDPAATLLADRKSSHDLLSRHDHIFRQPTGDESDDEDKEELARAIADFQEQLKRTPRDETLLSWYGGALLRAGRFDEAEDALRGCLALLSCSPHTRGLALYDLACVKARIGSEDECRTLLEESTQWRPLDKEHTLADRDFDSLREQSWFRQLVIGSEDV